MKVIQCEGGTEVHVEGDRIGARIRIDQPNQPNASALMTRSRVRELRDELTRLLGESVDPSRHDG